MAPLEEGVAGSGMLAVLTVTLTWGFSLRKVGHVVSVGPATGPLAVLRDYGLVLHKVGPCVSWAPLGPGFSFV